MLMVHLPRSRTARYAQSDQRRLLHQLTYRSCARGALLAPPALDRTGNEKPGWCSSLWAMGGGNPINPCPHLSMPCTAAEQTKAAAVGEPQDLFGSQLGVAGCPLGGRGWVRLGSPWQAKGGPAQRGTAGSTGVTLGTVWGCNSQNKRVWGQKQDAFWRALGSQEKQGQALSRCSGSGEGGKQQSAWLHHGAQCY